MKRILLVALIMALTVLVVGGVAWALTFTCTSADCIGTPQDDVITGADRSQFFDARAGNDAVQGRGDNDTIHGRSGFDDLTGDGANDPANDGFDIMFGEGRPDFLEGEGSVNFYFGGPGTDTIVPSILGPMPPPARTSLVVPATTLSQQTTGSSIMSSAVVAPRTESTTTNSMSSPTIARYESAPDKRCQ